MQKTMQPVLHTWNGFRHPWMRATSRALPRLQPLPGAYCIWRQHVHRITEGLGWKGPLIPSSSRFSPPAIAAPSLPWREAGEQRWRETRSRGGSARPRGATTHWQPMHSSQVWNGSLLWREEERGKSPAGDFHTLPAINHPSRFSSFAVTTQEGALMCPLPFQRCHARSPIISPLFLFWCMLKVIWKGKSWVI